MSNKTNLSKVRGKIIRILDATTVIINLGQADGITDSSVFSILGGPEEVIDPFSKEVLGTVSVVKGRVKTDFASERFTIATSKWTERYSSLNFFQSLTGNAATSEVSVDKDLRVKKDEIRPWRAYSEDFVRVGDDVEVSVHVPPVPSDGKDTESKDSAKNNSGD